MASEFTPGHEQQRVIDSDAPLTAVIGGAGTGKTTCASAAARRYLEHKSRTAADRVLFLSFSRASVSRITDRSTEVLGPYKRRVDVTTFHALAWSIVTRFGAIVGHPNPILASPAHHHVHHDSAALKYDDLIQLALTITQTSPAVLNHLQARWGLVIADEYQDTDNAQQKLLDTVAAKARLIVLGDANQCIYTFRKKDGVRAERLAAACQQAGTRNTIVLPDVSRRDPTGLIPAVATAVLRRDFESEAIAQAVTEGRLHVHPAVTPTDEIDTVAQAVNDLQNDGLGVAVFSHHNDMLAALSDGLKHHDINHEIAGLDDAVAAALDAQVAMLRHATGDFGWREVNQTIAVFVASATRGNNLPALVEELRSQMPPQPLRERLDQLSQDLTANELPRSLEIASSAHQRLDLPAKQSAWTHAATLLRPIAARALRELGHRATVTDVTANIQREAKRVVHDVLLGASENPAEVQLMNLHQTKGREADATVVVLRATDFFGRENHPFPDTSKLLYVVFSRARHRIVVIIVGQNLPPAIAPIARIGH